LRLDGRDTQPMWGELWNAQTQLQRFVQERRQVQRITHWVSIDGTLQMRITMIGMVLLISEWIDKLNN
jgi:hypothetical protein